MKPRNFTMDDYFKCKICKESDHEGQYCRCESRNIRISKEKRKRDQGFWKSMAVKLGKS